MGFSQGSFLKAKEVTVYDNYTNVKCSITMKNPKTGQRELSFAGFVRFISTAHKKGIKAEDVIKILKCDVTTAYSFNGEIRYTKPVFSVMDFERLENVKKQRKKEVRPSVETLETDFLPVDDFDEIDFEDEIPF